MNKLFSTNRNAMRVKRGIKVARYDRKVDTQIHPIEFYLDLASSKGWMFECSKMKSVKNTPEYFEEMFENLMVDTIREDDKNNNPYTSIYFRDKYKKHKSVVMKKMKNMKKNQWDLVMFKTLAHYIKLVQPV
jgi:hypothetical protein